MRRVLVHARMRPFATSAHALPALAEVMTWNIPHVAEFAAGLGLDKDDVKILSDNKINGTRLLKLTEDKLRAAGMALGPASDLAAAIDKFRYSSESAADAYSSFFAMFSVCVVLFSFCLANVGASYVFSILHSLHRRVSHTDLQGQGRQPVLGDLHPRRI